MSEEKKANIRNSTAEFLIFTGQSGENSIEVRVAEGSVWLTQKLMGTLFKVSVKTINEHLINLFNRKELLRESTIRNFRIVQRTYPNKIFDFFFTSPIRLRFSLFV